MENYASWAGTLGTLAFGALSVYFYYRPRRFRCIEALWQITSLHTKTHPQVRILFNDVEVDNLSRYRVLVKNVGAGEIRRGDLHEEKITIGKEDSRILSSACIAGNIQENGAFCKVDQNCIAACYFEYMNAGDHIGIELLYTGEAPEINARVIGGEFRRRKYRGSSTLAAMVALVSWLVVFLVGVAPPAFIIGFVGGYFAIPSWLSGVIWVLAFLFLLRPINLLGDRVGDAVSRWVTRGVRYDFFAQ